MGNRGLALACAAAVAAVAAWLLPRLRRFDVQVQERLEPVVVSQLASTPVNDYLLQHVNHTGRGVVLAAETIVASPQGRLFAFDERSGFLFTADSIADPAWRRLFHVGGRTLGAVYSAADDSIVACNVAFGLVRIDVAAASVSILSNYGGDAPVQYCDDVAIGVDGRIYFSDAMLWAPVVDQAGHWNTMHLSLVDILRGRGDGRLLQYDPTTRATTVLVDGLHFANGVAVSPRDEFVVVAETYASRLVRVWLTGPRKGFREIFAELPCFPDGIRPTEAGDGYWVACPSYATRAAQLVGNSPLLRWLLAQFTPWSLDVMHSLAVRTGLVLRLDGEGGLRYVLEDRRGENVHFVSAVTEHAGMLLLGQLYGNSVPIVPVPVVAPAAA